ncbi:baculoviral IAP repeat-containing protein 3-like [Planococcus citri]|uniref:baculoviral IAP repeat-containing protein 3-like n=1 Tax=Planococcus citri TaxID=170843 RepID=UPI0031FA06A3
MCEIVNRELTNKPICNDLKTIIEFQSKVVLPKATCNFPHYSSFEERMKSFDSWPKSMKMKPAALSEAGFFYLGHDDRAVCFYCGGGLNEWKEFDDPWVEHAYWFPKCKFVLSEKGKEFIDKAVERKAEIIAVQNSETIVSAIDEIMDLIHLKKKKPVVRPKTKVIPALRSDSRRKEAQVDADSEKNNDQNSQPSLLCKICSLEEKNVLFIPCKHVAVCMKCSVPLSSCPVCEKTIADTLRIYNS